MNLCFIAVAPSCVKKTMSSYEQTLHLFGRWLSAELKIYTVDKISENVIRKYIDDLMVRGNLILTVMLAFAEYERGMIVERTQTGKAVARQDPNFREGRPRKFTSCQLQHALELLNSGKTYRQVEAMTGISKRTLIRADRNI